jgi:hypothetical protein
MGTPMTKPEANNIDDYDKLFGATFLLDPMQAPGNVATKATVLKHKTGIVILLNNALISVFSKQQNKCESSTYGSELVAMQIT